MSGKLAYFLFFKLLGWKSTGLNGVIPEEKCIILAAPHTSIWDFAVGYLFYKAYGGKPRTMIKKEAFSFPPVAHLLRKMGGFPIDRANPKDTMESILTEMRKNGPFQLVICPEGTRKAVKKWKTGYHLISSEAGIPVWLCALDYKQKTLNLFRYGLTELSAREDTDRIQEIYRSLNLTALHPDGYSA